MDPNANLDEQRRLSAALLDEASEGYEAVDREKARRLAELVQALDDWILNGGFMPSDWKYRKGER